MSDLMRRIDRVGNERLDKPAPDFSPENLGRLIATLPDWSMKRPWTKEQTAAWRLHWFGRTPEQDAEARENSFIERERRLRSGEELYPAIEREPFLDWPNGQGTYD